MKVSGTTPRRNTGRPLSFDRDAVLEKAMLSFWQYGYETTSVSDLTRATGVNAPSLYAAFGDKRRLFLEAVRLYSGDMTAAARKVDGARSSYEAARTMLVGAATAFTSATRPRGCLLASATASGSAASADVQNAVADIRREIEGHLRRRIERDISSNVLQAETHASALSGMVIAVIQGMSVLARDGATRAHLLAITESAMRAFPKCKKSAHKRDTR